MILFVLPPLTQLNTPYPSITHLTGYLRSRGIEAEQMDLGIELINRLFTRVELGRVFDLVEARVEARELKLNKTLRIIVSNRHFYERNVEAVMKFLSGRDLQLANRFSDVRFWEDMHRLPDEEELEWAFGTSGKVDRAKYLCSLFLKNIVDVVQLVDEHFQLIRYAEKLCTYLTTFEPIEEELEKMSLTEKLSLTESTELTEKASLRLALGNGNMIEELMLEIFETKMQEVKPDWVGISVPFPGNLLAGLKCAKYVKAKYEGVKIVMGGGYVNTELRQMTDTGIFKYVDYITFDDGELPIRRLIEGGELLRTAYLKDGKVEFAQMDVQENEKFGDLPAPTMRGLDLGKYIDFVDTTNPMHRLWSDGRWNKMMLAHGCYWAKCAFCDTCLDYIGRFEACDVKIIVDRMETMIAETGNTGFHFVDEAAPPALLRKLAEEILERKLVVTYWTNVRFDKTYTAELCYLLARSGCIAVSGGLEVASPRVLKLINKGVTIESATECMRNLSANGIMVHTYLMYGFPTQTEKELYDSLGRVRDLFAEGLIQSAFWHRYAMTCHSPSGRNPESVGARHVLLHTEDLSLTEFTEFTEKAMASPALNPFANNEIPFEVDNEPDWDRFTEGLNVATYNYMRQTGFDVPLKRWFK
ncbi:MAG: radical SAM protein [Paludibacteraceae bacterium]|nr:radical SAM protein [Paludibacteraceae bacterium]